MRSWNTGSPQPLKTNHDQKEPINIQQHTQLQAVKHPTARLSTLANFLQCSVKGVLSAVREVKSLSGWCMDPGFKACTCKNIPCKNRKILCISSMQGPLQGKNDSFIMDRERGKKRERERERDKGWHAEILDDFGEASMDLDIISSSKHWFALDLRKGKR